MSSRGIGLILGIAAFVSVLIAEPPIGMSQAAWLTAGTGILMAIWWSTEAIPVPATSLLPVVLFPLLGLSSLREATTPYAHPVIFLLLGGFVAATALQRWNLHRRLALNILHKVGDNPNAIVAGFMGITAFLSMWISNTATTIMMVPIALSLTTVLFEGESKHHPFTICLLLGIAYSASIGGLGTLIGTPPNAMAAAYMLDTYGIEIGFLQWMFYGVPAVVILIPLAWLILTRVAFPFAKPQNSSAKATIHHQILTLGKFSTPEQRTAAVFIVLALAWITRPLLQKYLGLTHLSDTIIAICGALTLFLMPSGSREEPNTRLLDWESAQQIPWGVLLLFGGGLSLASMVNSSGLATWLGDTLAMLSSFHLLILLFALVTMVIFLTELTSNTATAATLLPVLGSIAVAAQFDPLLLTAPLALAASCAFMLPVATAPNAIVYSTKQVTIAQMARAGFYLNLIGIVVISMLSYALIPVLFMH